MASLSFDPERTNSLLRQGLFTPRIVAPDLASAPFDKLFTVPSDCYWQIVGAVAEYTAGSLSGDRIISLTIGSGSFDMQFVPDVYQQGSSTRRYIFGVGLALAALPDFSYIPICPIVLPPGSLIVIGAASPDPSDEFSSVVPPAISVLEGLFV